MPRIAVLMPGQRDAQRFVGPRVPIPATGRCGADLQWYCTGRTDTACRYIVAADCKPTDFSFGKGAAQTVDIGRIDDGGLDAGRIEFGEALILPAAIRSAESVPVLMLDALMLTALTCAAVNVPV